MTLADKSPLGGGKSHAIKYWPQKKLLKISPEKTLAIGSGRRATGVGVWETFDLFAPAATTICVEDRNWIPTPSPHPIERPTQYKIFVEFKTTQNTHTVF